MLKSRLYRNVGLALVLGTFIVMQHPFPGSTVSGDLHIMNSRDSPIGGPMVVAILRFICQQHRKGQMSGQVRDWYLTQVYTSRAEYISIALA